jgi:4a-hydroxytetrahydrobiopterin dehydratase
MDKSLILNEWKEIEGNLYRKFVFKTTVSAIEFVNKVLTMADKINHHPRLTIEYNKVEISITTIDKGRIVTEKDVEFAIETNKIIGMK